ncbi:hypothetical protein HII36_47635 [Nonomuraea sp. NN258]|uniref:hypothetical protein n=1 Tax=Nonomuraea antri TaxID=2730852 RepID=UPI001569454B|nr:hypothetical protein [Nonomuraea antri]NRQ39449.1 hypothetical protein [Nonomuraea antri]
MRKAGEVVRLAAAGAVLAALGYGTVYGTDDLFPFGPMVQYAFSIPPDGEIKSLILLAETAKGTTVEVPIEPYYVGVRRAEVEGQLGRYVREPALMQHMADTHARLRPQDPRLTRLRLVTRVIKLKDRRPDRTYDVERVSWTAR